MVDELQNVFLGPEDCSWVDHWVVYTWLSAEYECTHTHTISSFFNPENKPQINNNHIFIFSLSILFFVAGRIDQKYI